jgi:cytochrome b subunit of formate dehydrogenase
MKCQNVCNIVFRYHGHYYQVVIYNIILLKLMFIIAVLPFQYVVILGGYLFSSYSHLVFSWGGRIIWNWF